MDDHSSAAKMPPARGETLNDARFETADADCDLAVQQRVRDFNVMVRRSVLWRSLILSLNLVDNALCPAVARRRLRHIPYAGR
jgi:hypothetical protein